MSFIRPEARAGLWRWRELAVAAPVLGLGFHLVLGPGGLLGWVGWGLVIAALALAAIGIQRARFRLGGGGPGVVQVDEGRIIYFGPLSGGALAVADIERLTLDPTARPAHWLLEHASQPPLCIPVNAAGAEALFDVFSALPGLKTERMLGELRGHAAHPVVIWERRALRPVGQRLH